jgi:sulfatase maturation enzyme AslB (radical SAM superfamily)
VKFACAGGCESHGYDQLRAGRERESACAGYDREGRRNARHIAAHGAALRDQMERNLSSRGHRAKA